MAAGRRLHRESVLSQRSVRQDRVVVEHALEVEHERVERDPHLVCCVWVWLLVLLGLLRGSRQRARARDGARDGRPGAKKGGEGCAE